MNLVKFSFLSDSLKWTKLKIKIIHKNALEESYFLFSQISMHFAHKDSRGMDFIGLSYLYRTSWCRIASRQQYSTAWEICPIHSVAYVLWIWWFLTVNQSPPPLVFLLKILTMSATAVSYVVSGPNSLGLCHFSSRTRPRNGFLFSSVATPSWRSFHSLRPPSILFKIPHGFSKRSLKGSKPFSPVMQWQDST